MNFLTIVLCIAMNKAYQAYYFVPLITFWYSLQYAVTAIPPVVRGNNFLERLSVTKNINDEHH